MSHSSISHQNLSILTKVFLLSLLLTANIQVQAKVYKWIDKNGKTHYSDKPFDEKSQEVEIKKEPTEAEIYRAKKRASLLIDHQNKVQEIAEENANDKRIADAKKEKANAKLAHICNEAKTEIRMLGRGFRSYTENKEGKRHYLSDQEKIEKIAALQKNVQEQCKNL